MNSVISLSNIRTEFKLSMRLILPLMASELIYALNGFIATIMIAHLGKVELAANALVWGIYLAVILFFIGVFSSVGIMVAQGFGAKDNQGVSICFKQGLLMAIFCALPMMLVMWLSPIILVWTGQDPEVIVAAKSFFYALIWTMLPLNIGFVIEQFLVSITKARLVMFMVIIQVPLQVFFYYVFLFGKLGFPKFGLAGVGYSILVVQWLIMVYFVVYLYKAKSFKIYNLFDKWWIINRKFFFELMHIGLPLGLIYSLELLYFSAITLMMGCFGTTTLAAYQIAYQYFVVALGMIFAFSQTATVRVGNEVGKNNRDNLKLTLLVNMGICLLITLLASIFYIKFPYVAISADVNVHLEQLHGMVQLAAAFLSIIGILTVTDSIRLVSLGALRGLKDTKFPLLLSITGFWGIAFPTAYVLAFKLHLGGVGILWGTVFGLFITGIMLFIRFNKLIKHINLASLVTKNK